MPFELIAIKIPSVVESEGQLVIVRDSVPTEFDDNHSIGTRANVI